MTYKIEEICSTLGIGKSTIYKRIGELKKDIPEPDWKLNVFFYYENNKLFITDKGFEFIKNYSSQNTKTNQEQQNDNCTTVNLYQNQIIDIYKERIEYLESENKRLLDIISIKEQKELAKDVNFIREDNFTNNKNTNLFFSKLFDKFRFKK